MTKARNIFRMVFFLVAVLLLVYINKTTNENTQSIAEFKFKMFQKIQRDSLDSKHKVNMLIDETTQYVDNSSHVKEGIHYLTMLFGLLVVAEVVFLVLNKRNERQEIN